MIELIVFLIKYITMLMKYAIPLKKNSNNFKISKI